MPPKASVILRWRLSLEPEPLYEQALLHYLEMGILLGLIDRRVTCASVAAACCSLSLFVCVDVGLLRSFQI